MALSPLSRLNPAWFLVAPVSTVSSGAVGTVGPPPSGYPKLVYAASPGVAETYTAFVTRTGLSQKFGEEPGAATYGVADQSDGAAYPSMKVVAKAGTQGANGGFLFGGMPGDTVAGGPNPAFFRAKVFWKTGLDYNPHFPNGDRAGAGGCKFIGPWGGLIPATGAAYTNAGWALRNWTGNTQNWTTIGRDTFSFRDANHYGTTVFYFYPMGNTNNVWRVDQNQGRWVQLEWEIQIETSAGGAGWFKYWIDGNLGLYQTGCTFFNPAQWVSGVGLKGAYFTNFWGGSGIALSDTPLFYKDVELWGK